MKSVMYEWKKFRAFRYFWFLCSVFFLFNIWTLSEKMKMEMYGETDLRRFEGTAGRKA